MEPPIITAAATKEEEVLDVSRSGRIRRKSVRLLDFESPDPQVPHQWENKENGGMRGRPRAAAIKARIQINQLALETQNISPKIVVYEAAFRNSGLGLNQASVERQNIPPTPSPSEKERHTPQQNEAPTATEFAEHLNDYEAMDRSNSNADITVSNNLVSTDPIDAAAHLKLLGENLTKIGEQLKEHQGAIAPDDSLTVLLDTLLCSMGPLMCLTKCLPGMENNEQLNANLAATMDNLSYIMPVP